MPSYQPRSAHTQVLVVPLTQEETAYAKSDRDFYLALLDFQNGKGQRPTIPINEEDVSTKPTAKKPALKTGLSVRGSTHQRDAERALVTGDFSYRARDN